MSKGKKRRGQTKKKRTTEITTDEKGTNDATYLVEYSLWFETRGEGGGGGVGSVVNRLCITARKAKVDDDTSGIDFWHIAFYVDFREDHTSAIQFRLPPPPPPPPIKIRSVINGMSRDIFRPSFMYEAPITIGRRIIETSASIDRQPRYRQLLSALRGVARMHACVRALEKMRRHSSLFLQNFVQTFHMENLSTPFSAHILEIWFFLFFFFRCPEFDSSVDRNFTRDILYFSRARIYIYFFFRIFRDEWKRKIKIWR